MLIQNILKQKKEYSASCANSYILQAHILLFFPKNAVKETNDEYINKDRLFLQRSFMVRSSPMVKGINQ